MTGNVLTPPNDLGAEQIVLGSMMLADAEIGAVTDIIGPGDYYKPIHSTIHDAIVDLYNRGEPTELTAVVSHLTSTGDITRVGGTGYLHKCVAEVAITASAGYYARLVLAVSQQRHLGEVAARLARAAQSPDPEAAQTQFAQIIAEHTATQHPARTAPRLLEGGSFVLDVPDIAPAVWGGGKDVIWPQGEAIMICGSTGVGKTTLAQQLLRARLGLQHKVLGYPVEQTGGRVLYLVMDRPAQFQRAARRLFTPDDREVLNERLVVWKGPPPRDLAEHPEMLAELCDRAHAGTVFVDSVKDAAVGISKDEVGAAYNRARQTALAEGIEVAELHHMRKSNGDNKRPNSLDDIYGSTWITAGAGSVVLLWGEAGDPVVEWRHLKQPESEVGPFKITHDHDTGVSEVEPMVDLKAMVIRTGVRGLIALDYAVQAFGVTKPSDAQKKKAARFLDRKVREGFLIVMPGASGGDASRYFLAHTD